MRIEEAIKQEKFQDEFEKANINLLYTANWMNSQFGKALRPFDISSQQFNILRILRGQKGKPATLKLLTDRMLDQMSNTSRLVDKMLAKDLLKREICANNRRQLEISITQKGLDICEDISKEVNKIRSENKSISKEEAQELNRILDKLRSQ